MVRFEGASYFHARTHHYFRIHDLKHTINAHRESELRWLARSCFLGIVQSRRELLVKSDELHESAVSLLEGKRYERALNLEGVSVQ